MGYGQAPFASITTPDITDSCPSFAVRFIGVNTGGPATSITWTYGGIPPDVIGPTNGVLTPTAIFNTPGRYTVYMTLTNASGTSVSNQIIVNVRGVPTVDFSASATTGCYPFPVTFTNLSSPAASIISYSWDFGDGYTSTAASPQHTYTLPANYSVTLKAVNNQGCSASKTDSAYIKIPTGVVANFSLDSLSGSCKPPTTAYFNNQSIYGGTPSYTWNFGDGSPTSSQVSPKHVYAAAGKYPVTLTVQSSLGCTDSRTDTVTIGAASVNSGFTSPDTVCVGTPATFTNTSTPTPNGSIWKFGDGKSQVSYNGSNAYAAAGTFTVTLINQFSSCSDSAVKPIVVIGPPVTNFSAITATNSCKFPFTVNFQDLSTGARSWQWDFGDGSTSTARNPSHTYLSYGQFDVTLVVTNAGGCSAGATKTQFVKVVQPAVSAANLPGYGCAPYAFTLNPVYTAVDGIVSYSWNMGNGNTYTTANPPLQNYGPGIYIVRGSIVTTGGCVANYVDTIKVGTIKPVPNFSATPIPACVKQLIQFKDLSTGSPDQWMWYFGDGSTWTSQDPKHAYALPGSYSVKLVVYDNGCSDSITKPNYITVNPPLSKFGYTYNCANKTQYTFHDSSIGATSWTWIYGDGSTATGQNPAPHTYLTPGVYKVSLVVGGGACSDTSSLTITVGIKPDFVVSPDTVCKGSLTIVSATQFAPSTIAWWWDFGDGTPPIGPASPSWSHTYAGPGTYRVKLTVIDSTGCADSVFHNARVNGPTANFGAPVTQSCTILNASFSDSSKLNGGASPIVSWIWDFGDGTKGTGPKVAHPYTVQGSYPVKLKITDAAGCSDSIVKSNYITLSVLKVSFSTQDSQYCPSSLIKFNNTSDPTGGFNTQYTWDFGNGTYQGFSPPLHNYPNVGVYTVSLMAQDKYGCTASYIKPKYITIDTPNASFTIDNAFAACPPLNVNFQFTGHYAKSLLFNFGSGQGVSDAPTTRHLYGLPGIYTASLTVTSPGGCIASTSKTIQVNGPLAKLTFAPVGGCDTLTVNFNALSSGVTRFIWYFSDNSPVDTTTVPYITHTYLSPGKYFPTIQVTDSTNCSVFYQGDSIIVDSVKAKFIADRYRLCENGVVNFTNNSDITLGTVITNYYWDFGDGITVNGNQAALSHNFTSPGLYRVKMVVTTQFGCTDSAFQQIYVVANPVVDIKGDSSQCVPATLNLAGVILVPDTSLLAWHWNFDNGDTSNLQVPPPQTYPKPGHYIIQLIAWNSSGCSDTATADEYVYPLPVVFAGNDTTICLGQSLPLLATGAATYTWLPPSNASLSCTNCANPVASPAVNTTYYVTGTSVLGCNASDSIVVTVNQPVTVTVSPNDSVCIGQSAQLVASGAAIYQWSPAAGLSNVTVANPLATPSLTTTYQVVGSDNKYCFFDTGYINVRVFNYPVINAGPDATITVGSSYQMTGSGSPDIISIAWSPATSLTCTDCYTPVANPVNTTDYVLKAVNDGGCTSADSVRLTVICNNTNFFIPNTFSPNGDGVNDVFYVRGKGLNIITSITIFNRWGQIVFQRKDFAPNDPSAGWDGTFNGQKAAADVYIYTIEMICDNSSLVPYHGNVTLIR